VIPELKLEFAFQVRIDFKERIMFGETPSGSRGYVPPTGGWVEGPRLKGKVRPYSGADWAFTRNDGVLELSAHYMLEAEDGTPIYIRNSGYLWRHNGEAKIPFKAPLPPEYSTYFRITPTFDVPVGPHDWLTRTVIVGTGERRSNPDHSIFTYYAVL